MGYDCLMRLSTEAEVLQSEKQMMDGWMTMKGERRKEVEE